MRIYKKKYIQNFFIINVILLLFYIKKKYSNQNIVIPLKEKGKKLIPKIIHCTYSDILDVPLYVLNNLKKYASDYKFIFYNDDDCINFLEKNYNNLYVNKFKNLVKGAHKADFFRYCVLYCLGGVYIDIKISPKKKFNEIFDHNKKNVLYTCLGSKGSYENIFDKFIRNLQGNGNGHIFQAIIATYPGNEIFKPLIKDFFVIDNPHNNYHIFTYKFYDVLKKKTGKYIDFGIHKYSNQEVILFREINKKIDNEDKKDRHGGFFYVNDENNKLILRSRYIDFPWNNKKKEYSKIFKIIQFRKYLIHFS